MNSNERVARVAIALTLLEKCIAQELVNLQPSANQRVDDAQEGTTTGFHVPMHSVIERLDSMDTSDLQVLYDIVSTDSTIPLTGVLPDEDVLHQVQRNVRIATTVIAKRDECVLFKNMLSCVLQNDLEQEYVCHADDPNTTLARILDTSHVSGNDSLVIEPLHKLRMSVDDLASWLSESLLQI